ncbi:CrcB protein [Virgibacillus natechei]|uniref:Fluoride-specific ion channel FluC n=1 Tax=Virgibacillus natechei TaxID=1216297 RepID=A0ABS4IHQ5_9BACI|nr:CrcB family protein [Virgibacillus natechei]MBP1970473.1 CrcB protein [Virgibacillus natechei]UZD13878.1 CrcB family protein [Virgibacillus natechei]
MKDSISHIVAIGIGGALGTLSRHLINYYTLFTAYPIGTVIENIVGTFLLGGLTGWFIYRNVRPWLKAGMGVGFCGGFTTMSTLAADTIFLTQTNSIFAPFIYVVSSLFGGIIFAFFGYFLGSKLSKRTSQQKSLKSFDV